MQPQQGTKVVQIPITFDSRSGGGMRASNSGKPLWAFLIVLFWVLSSIMVAVAAEGHWRLSYPVVSLIILIYVLRFIIVREKYYKKRRAELEDHNYMFPHSVFWNIYEISNRKDHMVSFGGDFKGIFVALDKDVIVGKDTDYDYHHHEAIADAYQQMAKRGIECIHLDLMDTVGRDDRIQNLFSQAEETENTDLKDIMFRVYDHMEVTMNQVYASYDIYCFYYGGKEVHFWDELEVVLSYFRQANYIRARVLDRDEISEITKSLMNIDTFSVNNASDMLFKELNRGSFLRTIWTEVDGARTTVNKTLDEMNETNRVKESEKRIKKRGRKPLFRRKKVEEDIDLFD